MPGLMHPEFLYGINIQLKAKAGPLHGRNCAVGVKLEFIPEHTIPQLICIRVIVFYNKTVWNRGYKVNMDILTPVRRNRKVKSRC
jgi:hypothetical protein